MAFGEVHVAPQPLCLTKCLLSCSAEYDASDRDKMAGDQATLSGERKELDERGRARGEEINKGSGLHRGVSPYVPSGGPWDSNGPQRYLVGPA